MKKALMILGAIFVVLVALVVVGITILAVKGNALDRESKKYADDAIRAILSQRDGAEIRSRASPELKKAVNDADWEKVMKMFRRLGKVKTVNELKGQATMSVTSQNGKVISAQYVATADFDAGPGDVVVSVIKHGTQWQLLGFKIDSKVFLEQP